MFYEKPFKHHIIDNFFDKDTLKYCISYLESIPKKQNNHTVIKDKKLISYFDAIFTEKFLNKNFPKHKPYKQLQSIAEVNICTNGYSFPIHDEAPYKILSTVVYLAPLHATGTILYNRKKEIEKIITWKPNRAFTFCGETHKTWHTYGHWDKSTRVTINYFKKYFNVL